MTEPVQKLMKETQEKLDDGQEKPCATIAESLVRAQSEMKHAHLDGSNPHFKSRYSTLQSVIDAVKPALNRHGIAFVQKAHPHEKGVMVETVFLHESGESLSAGLVFVPTEKQNAHGMGSAYTYAKRYGLAMACGIGADEDDDGNSAVEAAKERSGVSATVAKDAAAQLTQKAKEQALEAADKIDSLFSTEPAGNGRDRAILEVEMEELEKAIDWVKSKGTPFWLVFWDNLPSATRSYLKAKGLAVMHGDNDE